ncbi:penicillin-binding protein activator [Psychromonas ingrahamii]|uniref:penicillin-binding protein activator n=1 Tax=Psychromonas ingrahamii TaxID=357794 RepID=UPI0002EC56E5|nr:penicillin-binding protein activator [Psychromonas ingrahamii]
MNVLTSAQRFSYLLMISLTMTFLTACSTSPSSPKEIPPELFSELANSSAYYLQKDQLYPDSNNVDWQLLTVQALIEEGRVVLADSIISHMQSKTLSGKDKTSLGLLIAQNLFAKNQFDESQKALSAIDPEQLSQLASIASLSLQADLYIKRENHLAASNLLLILTPLLQSDKSKQKYNDILLTQLSFLPAKTLNQYETVDAAKSPIEQNFEKDLFKKGWYALASIFKRYQLRINLLKQGVSDWKKSYPQHPVLLFMPTQLTNIHEIQPFQPENIAVLLPLSGRFQEQGKSIKLGILDAFYRQQQLNKSTSTDALAMNAINSPTLHFYDSHAQTMKEITTQFAQNKIDFVIGPLLKNEIETFLPLVEKMPVLALNGFPENSLNSTINKPETVTSVKPWHYSFSLSPEHEAEQAVQFISENKHQNPLIIAPDSDYGKRVAEAFKNEWQTRYNREIEQHFFTSKSKLDSFIERVLYTDQSQTRINQMKSLTRLSLETAVRSRTDIDAIYLVSKRDELILLKPFIDVTVSPFADRIPLYASSRSHQFDRGGLQNKELSNFTFSDMPFLIHQQDEIITTLNEVLPRQSYAALRLFALGFDSYQLIGQLMQLQTNKDYYYPGLGGQLSLDLNNTVQPALSWATYYQGELVEVASPTTSE